MTYLVVGTLSLVKEEINKIIDKYHINNDSIIKYDLNINTLEDVLIDINTISLFNDIKCIICNNIDNIDNIDKLKEYLKNENNNILIFIMEKTTSNKLIYNLFKNNNLIDLSKIDINSYIKKELKDYKISNIDIELIIGNCNKDFNRIKNEVDKLKMYKYDDKVITRDDINLVIKKSFDNTIFDLIDYINKKDKNNAYKICEELIKNNEVPIKILITLANNYRLIYQIKVLKDNNSDKEIMDMLDIKKEGRLYILKKQSYNFTSNRLLSLIKELAKADLNIKKGIMSDKSALELFISKI